MTLRDIAPAAFVPPAVFAVGQGAIAPVIVISATDLGASAAVAALVVAMAGLGQIAADIPAGSLVHRFGERPTMIGAALLTVLALVGCMFADHIVLFAAAIFVTGACTAVWLLARQAYVTEVVPYRLRATAMSTLGGVFRIGLFVGPFVGSAAVHAVGLWGAYAVHIVAALIAAGILLFVGDLKIEHDVAPAGRASACVVRDRAERAALGVRHPRRRRDDGQRDPRGPAGGAAAVGSGTRPVGVGDLADLRHLRRGRHAAVLPRRQGDGPVRPDVGGHPGDQHPGALAASCCHWRRTWPG